MTKWKLGSLSINSWECVEIDDKFQPVRNIIIEHLIILDGKA